MTQRVAIVTGAGSGIGAATARRLAAQGVRLALVGRRQAALDATAASCARDGEARVVTVAADLEDLVTPQLVVEQTLDAFGQIDHVVNNAAYIRNVRLSDVTQDDVRAAAAINMSAPLFLIQAALPALLLSSGASVVNVSSAAASMARPTQTVYGMTKAALEHMTRSLAIELAPSIRVNAVAPGPTDTEMMARSGGADADERRRVLRDAVPLGRLGTADEVARWIVELLHPDSAWVTGVVLPIDGGRILGDPGSV